MVLVRKWPFFELFFSQYRPGKCLFRYSRPKNPFLRFKNNKFKKSQNWHFSKEVNPWFWSKNGPSVPTFFFLGNIGQENVFYDIQGRKNAFLRYKNKKFKNRKILIFPKGLTHGFGPKMPIFPSFFFWQYRPEKGVLR